VRRRRSWEAGGSALDGKNTTRKTRSQAWNIAPQLDPTVTEEEEQEEEEEEEEEQGQEEEEEEEEKEEETKE